MYSIEIIKDLAAVAKLKREWNALWVNSIVKTPYQRWEWNYAWLKSSSEKRSIHVVTARQKDGKLVGVAPLRAKFCLGPKKCLTFISQEASIYPDFILEEKDSKRILTDFLEYLNADPTIVALDLKVAEPSSTVSIITDALKKYGWYSVQSNGYTKRLLINIGEDYEKYLTTLSKKMRQEIGAETRKIEKMFQVEFLCADEYSNFESSIDTLFSLNALRWGGDPRRNHISRHACYREFWESGLAKIFVLTCNGNPVGAVSGLIADRTLFAEIAGFDYSLAKVDIGKVLYHYLFKWAINFGLYQIDFSSGEESYKLRYQPESLNKWVITAYRTNYSSTIIDSFQWLSNKIYQLKSMVSKSWLSQNMGLYGFYKALKNRKLHL